MGPSTQVGPRALNAGPVTHRRLGPVSTEKPSQGPKSRGLEQRRRLAGAMEASEEHDELLGERLAAQGEWAPVEMIPDDDVPALTEPARQRRKPGSARRCRRGGAAAHRPIGYRAERGRDRTTTRRDWRETGASLGLD
jgi:hypothetical protein